MSSWVFFFFPSCVLYYVELIYHCHRVKIEVADRHICIFESSPAHLTCYGSLG